MQEAIICKNCGNQFKGKFCNNCGEKVYTEHDKSFKHFIEEGFHFLTHFDSKFFKSWWLVMTKPGYVSSQISHGIRKPYFKPFSIFLLGVVLYLIFPIFPGLNVPMKEHVNGKYKAISAPLAARKIRSKNISLDALAKEFDEKSPKFAKVLLLVIVPLSAFGLQLMFMSKHRYYFDHLLVASEINTFYLYFHFFIVPLILTVIILLLSVFGYRGHVSIGDGILKPVYLCVTCAYCTAIFRRFYNQKTWRAICKAALFLFAHWLIVYILYRLILFCVVLLFI
jgi:hypothetical protein